MKFWKNAKIVKGNKSSFESTELTAAIAEKVAKKDVKKGAGFSPAIKKALVKIPWVTD